MSKLSILISPKRELPSFLESLIPGLNPNKAQGPDEIPPWFLRLGAEQVASPLQDLFQSSIDRPTSEVPQDWKDANVAAIFKKGSRTCAANYRPVSLTSVISKVMEHIVHSHVMKHLERQHILTDYQHGFRAKKSTETQLILTIHDLSSEVLPRPSIRIRIVVLFPNFSIMG